MTHSPDRSGTLVLLESLFCDNETNEDTLARYFARFEYTVASLARQTVPEGTQFQVSIYVSSDKGDWIRRVTELAGRAQADAAATVQFNVHQYSHPAHGYPASQPGSLDWEKSPNKHAPYREALFEAHHQDLGLERYERLVRVALDDDDIWLPWQLSTIVTVALSALSDPRIAPADVLAFGLLDAHVAYVHDDGVTVDSVALQRTLTGEKFYVLNAPLDVASVKRFSPWSIPEIMDRGQQRKLGAQGISLYAVRNYPAGFVYMRWGNNLSLQRKDGFIITALGSTEFASIEAVLAAKRDDFPVPAAPLWFGILREALAVSVSRSGNTVNASTNFDTVAQADSEIAFYLLQGATRVGIRGYSKSGKCTFDDAPAGVTVRAFHRRGSEITERAASRVV